MTEHSWHEEELLLVLRQALGEHRAAVLEDTLDLQADFYARFPLGRPLVDWEKVPNARTREVRFSTPDRRVRDEAPQINGFWAEVRSSYDVAPTRLAWVAFDALVGFGILIEVGALEELLVEILDCVPANVLVACVDLEWAMTYTMTDGLDFGLAPPQDRDTRSALPTTARRS